MQHLTSTMVYGGLANTLVSINEATLCRARLVLEWVTSMGFNSWCGKPVSLYNQPSGSTQLGHPSMCLAHCVPAKGR